MEITDVELSNVPAANEDGVAFTTLLCITSADGRQGWGEGRLGWREGELAERGRSLLAVLAGRSVFCIAELTATEFAHDPALACAVELALWDLVGQMAGQPLCNLWGGAYRAHVPLAVRMDADEFLANERLAGELVEHGHHNLVLASSGEVERDADAALRLHAIAGAGCAISLDGQSHYSPDAALRLCSLLPPGIINRFLDPLAGNDLADLCSLARLALVPLAVSRAIRDERQVMAIARAGGIDGVVIDPFRVGGLLAAGRALAVGVAGGLTVALDMQSSLGIAAAGMLHLAAATPGLDQPILCNYPLPATTQRVQGLSFFDGAATVPQKPGLGVSPMVDALSP